MRRLLSQEEIDAKILARTEYNRQKKFYLFAYNQGLKLNEAELKLIGKHPTQASLPKLKFPAWTSAQAK